MMKTGKLEALLWSIALPGLAQLLNKKVAKGSMFLVFELLLNMNSHLNLAVLYSFQGKIQEAIDVTDYQWLMFYPSVYMFAMWDAYREVETETASYSYLPFVIGLYFLTASISYSSTLKIGNILLGPVWLPALALLLGLFVGFLIKNMCLKVKESS
ncbi:hypothetical protein FZC66_06645 [Priestia megaterium]|nr:hypothetical protein FZC66_06645 [Priestia megaterium]